MGCLKALVLIVFGAAALWAVAVAVAGLGPGALALYAVALVLWIGLFAVLFPSPDVRAAAEPVPAEPVPAEPVPAEPVPAEPVPAEPVPHALRGRPQLPPPTAEAALRLTARLSAPATGTDGRPRLRPDGYTEDWPSISWAMRREARWKCRGCGVNLRGARHLLHVHHKNRNKQDNRPINLIALCVVCHCAQPRHGRLERAARSRGTYAAAESVRKAQNIGI